MEGIKMDLTSVGCGGMDWIQLAQDTGRWRSLVNAVMNFRVPSNAGNFLTGCKPVRFSIRTVLCGVSVSKCCVCGTSEDGRGMWQACRSRYCSQGFDGEA
jgi:hypothetical protein